MCLCGWLNKDSWRLASQAGCLFSFSREGKEGWTDEAGVLYRMEGLMQVSTVDDLFVNKGDLAMILNLVGRLLNLSTFQRQTRLQTRHAMEERPCNHTYMYRRK